MTSTPQDIPDVTPASLREWNHHVEAVMRGLAHALNNRAAALSAVIELSREPDDDPAATREILQGEMDRVAELVRVVRGIGVPRAEAEAFAPADLVRDLVGILQLHADLRDHSVEIHAPSAPAVRVPRWMLLRALVALAATAGAPGERLVRVTLAADGDWLTARAGAPRSSYMRELAAAMGGGALDDGSGFRIPTLESVRRREAR
jgi:hypothetical protein